MKRFFAILLSLIMVAGLLTGCGSAAPAPAQTESAPQAEDTGPAEPATETENVDASVSVEGYKLGGIDLTATGMTTFLTANTTLKDMCDTVGAEYISAPLPGYDDAGFMSAFESLIEQGCNGVMVYTFSEGPISLLADMFEEAGVDWFLVNRRISDDSLREKVFSLDHFVGNCYCEEEQNAYDMVCELNQELGVKNLAVIGLAQGDLNGDLRDKGIARACEETGVNLLTETRGISTVDDVTNAVEGIIATYPEVDGIFIVGGVVTTGALAGAAQALSNHGLSDKVSIAMVDIAAGMSEYMGEGQPLRLVTGGNLVMDNIIGGASLINHAMGVNTGDEPYIINTHMMSIRTIEDAENFDAYCENPSLSVIPGEKWFDTVIGKSVDEISDFSSSFSIEVAKELHE